MTLQYDAGAVVASRRYPVASTSLEDKRRPSIMPGPCFDFFRLNTRRTIRQPYFGVATTPLPLLSCFRPSDDMRPAPGALSQLRFTYHMENDSDTLALYRSHCFIIIVTRCLHPDDDKQPALVLRLSFRSPSPIWHKIGDAPAC